MTSYYNTKCFISDRNKKTNKQKTWDCSTEKASTAIAECHFITDRNSEVKGVVWNLYRLEKKSSIRQLEWKYKIIAFLCVQTSTISARYVAWMQGNTLSSDALWNIKVGCKTWWYFSGFHCKWLSFNAPLLEIIQVSEQMSGVCHTELDQRHRDHY